MNFFSTYKKHQTDHLELDGVSYPKYVGEFWTPKQRQASSIHEISYRACFKAQLPNFFIEIFSKKGDVIYDPFSGRGTTVIEAALLERNVIANDVNPLSRILSSPRFFIPDTQEVEKRLSAIPFEKNERADIDLSMFYHSKTESEIVGLKKYLKRRKRTGLEDDLDLWIRMVATNRLTGHSKGFFSVYTFPPNQAVGAERQKLINKKRKQKPEYRDTKKIILNKSKQLIKDLASEDVQILRGIGKQAVFLNDDARSTKEIPSDHIQLTVTSPPFLNVVQYADDNWLRFWFNDINAGVVAKKITMSKTLKDWADVMNGVFEELFRITRKGGWIAFEVGEVKNAKIKLEEYVVPLGTEAGFECKGIVINQQQFTKTSNIWGIKNNSKGTNSNRIVLFTKT
ncbi:site-specific DNA-methyltransferase [bacterium]|nr:MAG: site-specific DNA-methyltransferase [bacterium]